MHDRDSITLMLQVYDLKRSLSPECSSGQSSMVRETRPHPHLHSSVLTSFVRFVLGVVIVVFFQCMALLFTPVHRRGERIRWGLVSYTVAVFSVVTVFTTVNLYIQFSSFLDYRGFAEGGPLGYQVFIGPAALRITPSLTFLLNGWLANGLLVSSSFDAASTYPGI